MKQFLQFWVENRAGTSVDYRDFKEDLAEYLDKWTLMPDKIWAQIDWDKWILEPGPPPV